MEVARVSYWLCTFIRVADEGAECYVGFHAYSKSAVPRGFKLMTDLSLQQVWGFSVVEGHSPSNVGMRLHYCCRSDWGGQEEKAGLVGCRCPLSEHLPCKCCCNYACSRASHGVAAEPWNCAVGTMFVRLLWLPTDALWSPHMPNTQQCSVKKKLSAHEWDSSHNRRDQRFILVNVSFYLKGTARVWLETHEDDPTSRDQCKLNLHQVSWKPTAFCRGRTCILHPNANSVVHHVPPGCLSSVPGS